MNRPGVAALAATLAIAGLAATPRAARGQVPALLEELNPPRVTAYDDAVPTPEDVLGHRIGERHSRPEQIVRWFDAVAAASDRVRVLRHGRTHEGRDLLHAVVARPDRLADLDRVRSGNLRLSDPAVSGSVSTDSLPVVVYLGYSVHGNEASGSEAAMLALYHLAAGRGESVDRLLDAAVILIDPMLNPDGRDRFVDWVNGNRGARPVPDPADLEHHEPWPGGRGNHYAFDLNRDWLAAVHPESRARLALYHAWRPQLLADFHEMGAGSTFFFQPGVASRVNPLTPEGNRDLTARVAEYHARMLDRLGQPYFSGETFDDFFYGKGSTYPDLNGAVGILFEQASSRSLAVETGRDTLRFGHTVRNQLAATLSTLEAAVDLRRDLLDHQRAFYAAAAVWAEGRRSGGWVVSMERGADRARALARLLVRHGVEIRELAEVVEVGGRSFEVGRAWVAPADQPQARLLEALMAAPTEFPDSVFYDVSAWSMPLAFDVDAARLPRGRAGLIGAPFDPGVHAAVDPGEAGPGDVAAAVGWRLAWGGPEAARLLARWLEAGYAARVLLEPVVLRGGAGRLAAGRGTVVLMPPSRRDVDRERMRRLLASAGSPDGRGLAPVLSFSTPEGPDLGGPSSREVPPPSVALVVGDGIPSTRAGEVWHALSHDAGLRVSRLPADRLDRTGLSRYDVVIVPGGRIGEDGTTRLTAWTEAGGRLVVLGTAVDWAVRAGLAPLSRRPGAEQEDASPEVKWSERRAARGSQRLPGTIFDLRLDSTHPLAFGIGDRLPVFVSGDAFFGLADEASPGSVDTVGRFSATPLLAGRLPARLAPLASGSEALVVATKGRGRVVALAADPTFRGTWPGSVRLLRNAVFFAPVY
ncbi:MAG: M14 family metallopeptidase [Gemmatimonadota bacterium]|nr:M14 family metallopeptidase [Gemmatimonadota bacterium]